MIDKISRGWYPAGLVRYLMGRGTHEEHVAPRVIASWDGDPGMHQPARVGEGDFAYDKGEMGELIEDMSAPGKAAGLPDRAPKVGQKGSKYGWVWQCSLRNEDSDRVLSDGEWRGVAEDVMDRTGIAPTDDSGGCRWIAVRHDENHIHLMATLVRQDSERRFHPKNDFTVVRSVCREWETKLGLTLTAGVDKTATPAATRGEIEKAARRNGPHRPGPGGGGGGTVTAVLPSRVRLRQIVSQTAAQKRGAPEFLDALRAEGLRVHENHGPDGRLRGYAVGVSGDTDRKGKQVLFGGRTLAPDLSLPKLLQRWDSAPLPEVTVTPTRLSAVSPEDKVNGLRTGQGGGGASPHRTRRGHRVRGRHRARHRGPARVGGPGHRRAERWARRGCRRGVRPGRADPGRGAPVRVGQRCEGPADGVMADRDDGHDLRQGQGPERRHRGPVARPGRVDRGDRRQPPTAPPTPPGCGGD